MDLGASKKRAVHIYVHWKKTAFNEMATGSERWGGKGFGRGNLQGLWINWFGGGGGADIDSDWGALKLCLSVLYNQNI